MSQSPSSSLPGRLGGFVIAVGRRFYDDQCLMRASALAYTTLLSMVPLLAVVFAVLKGLGAQQGLGTTLLSRLSLSPNSERSSAHTGSTSAPSAVRRCDALNHGDQSVESFNDVGASPTAAAVAGDGLLQSLVPAGGRRAHLVAEADQSGVSGSSRPMSAVAHALE
jgi:hypothetical protein